MYPSQREFLKHIEEECVFIQQTVKGRTKEEISEDPILARALVRSLEIIGEAAKKVGEKVKMRSRQIDWKAIAGMRDKLVHDYFGIDYDIVYDAITNDIPELHDEILRLLAHEVDL